MQTPPALAGVAVRFHAKPWVDLAPGARAKISEQGERTYRLLELGPRFTQPGPCSRPHTGYVLSGRLEVVFPEGAVVLEAGDGLDIPAGEATAHTMRALMPRTMVFIVEPR
jgi:hypothetical protein